MKNKITYLINYLKSPISILILISLALTFIVETISRGSIKLSISFIYNNLLTFLFNALIILLTLSITLLVRRKIFTYSLLSMLWICISIGNNILLNLRGTPLTGNDFRLINSALQIIDTYLTKKIL